MKYCVLNRLKGAEIKSYCCLYFKIHLIHTYRLLCSVKYVKHTSLSELERRNNFKQRCEHLRSSRCVDVNVTC